MTNKKREEIKSEWFWRRIKILTQIEGKSSKKKKFSRRFLTKVTNWVPKMFLYVKVPKMSIKGWVVLTMSNSLFIRENKAQCPFLGSNLVLPTLFILLDLYPFLIL